MEPVIVHHRSATLQPLRWLQRRAAARADAPIAAAITLVGLLTLGAQQGGRSWASAVVLTSGIALVFRRSAPIATLLIVLPCSLLVTLAVGVAVPWALLVAVATVTAQLPARPLTTTCVAATCLAPLPIAITGNPGALVAAAFYEALIVSAWLAGAALRSRKLYLGELEDKASRLEAERTAVAARAMAEEQARLAREVHDIVAHSVGAIVVQASAAARAPDTQPAATVSAFQSIEDAGRYALRELRQALEPASEDDRATPQPQPGLPERIGDLERRLRPTGLVTVLDGIDRLADLDDLHAVAAYRFVQEALTNVVRHADAGRATVLARLGGDSVRIAVIDDGDGPPAAGFTAGRGLRGMHERAASLGGRVDVRPAHGGGTSVQLTLPPAPPPGA